MPDTAPNALVIRNARVVSAVAPPRSALARAEAMDALTVLPRAEVVVERGLIKSIKEMKPLKGGQPDALAKAKTLDAASKADAPSGGEPPRKVIDARGRVLMAGLVDCHTHACWAGGPGPQVPAQPAALDGRIDEWELKRKGVPYLKILERGGGIMASVRAVRAATQDQLTEQLLARLAVMLAHGTTTVEVKSGYGLTTQDELKMLRAIAAARPHFPGTICATALLGHAIDPDQPGFVGITLRQTLPAVVNECPGVCVDAYCEKGAWDVEQCVLLLNRAREMGCPVRVHADQFNDLGMAAAAVRLGARSVDHLEASTKEGLAGLAAAKDTAGVMLPACGFHLDGRYARGRRFVMDAGALCIASNWNPGSAPCPSMQFVIALAVRHLGLSVNEAITAATVNPARVLGLVDRGVIAPGMRADLVLLRHTDERGIAFEFGGNAVERVWCGGVEVSSGSSLRSATL